MTTPNHYEALLLDKSATTEQVRAAWKRLRRTAHPDAGATNEQFTAVRLAYETLSDPAKRAAYDASLRTDLVLATPEPAAEEWGTTETVHVAPPLEEVAVATGPRSWPWWVGFGILVPLTLVTWLLGSGWWSYQHRFETVESLPAFLGMAAGVIALARAFSRRGRRWVGMNLAFLALAGAAIPFTAWQGSWVLAVIVAVPVLAGEVGHRAMALTRRRNLVRVLPKRWERFVSYSRDHGGMYFVQRVRPARQGWALVSLWDPAERRDSERLVSTSGRYFTSGTWIVLDRNGEKVIAACDDRLRVAFNAVYENAPA